MARETKSRKKGKYAHIAFSSCMICLFIVGFVYQTREFLLLYWTYPTVVDIQQSSPSYIEIPAFTFCSRAGYIYKKLCEKARKVTGCGGSLSKNMLSEMLCKVYPRLCVKNGTVVPNGFKPMFYQKFMQKYEITREDFDIAMPLEEYLNCTIEFAGQSTPCNMDNVLGSFYSEDDLPQFCYSIYSNWGNPGKKREMMPKGATMKLNFFLNITQRPLNTSDALEYDYKVPGPLFNPPSEPSLQLAVHSPYFLPSPYFEGTSFKAGKHYEIRIKLNERHLLEAPYQTNCTDYMKTWIQRGGRAPINQLSVIQECRANKSFEKLGCVPVKIDYPHNYNICRSCAPDETCKYAEPQNDCTLLADDYNQPCDSIIYEVEREDKVITLFKPLNSLWSKEGLVYQIAEHDCTGHKCFLPDCSKIEIHIPFDRFEITNITYNPKYESLELFSVIGGYMGMWLGISLLAIFQFADHSFFYIISYIRKKRERRVRIIRKKIQSKNNYDTRKNNQYFINRSVR